MCCHVNTHYAMPSFQLPSHHHYNRWFYSLSVGRVVRTLVYPGTGKSNAQIINNTRVRCVPCRILNTQMPAVDGWKIVINSRRRKKKPNQMHWSSNWIWTEVGWHLVSFTFRHGFEQKSFDMFGWRCRVCNCCRAINVELTKEQIRNCICWGILILLFYIADWQNAVMHVHPRLFCWKMLLHVSVDEKIEEKKMQNHIRYMSVQRSTAQNEFQYAESSIVCQAEKLQTQMLIWNENRNFVNWCDGDTDRTKTKTALQITVSNNPMIYC